MNARRLLESTFWVMIFLQTVGSVDLPRQPGKGSPLGGQGTRKLPSPKSYVATFVIWMILGLFAEAGQAQARAAARLSVLIVLVGAVVGPFGKTITGFLEGVAKQYATAPSPDTSSPPAPTTPGGFV